MTISRQALIKSSTIQKIESMIRDRKRQKQDVLNVIAQYGKLNQQQIVERTGISKWLVTGYVVELHIEGEIERHMDEHGILWNVRVLA